MSERDPAGDSGAIVVRQGITPAQIEEAVLLEDCTFYDPAEFRRYLRESPHAVVFTASAPPRPFREIRRHTRLLLWRLGHDRDPREREALVGLLMGEMEPGPLRRGVQVCVLHTIAVSAFETQRKVLDELIGAAREACAREKWERIDVDFGEANHAYEEPLLDSGFAWLERRQPGESPKLRWIPPPQE